MFREACPSPRTTRPRRRSTSCGRANTRALDAQRCTLPRLHGGEASTPTSQLERALRAAARAHVFGNPHSGNPTSSSRSTELCDRARRGVLDFFNAAPDEWVVDLHRERQPGAEARGRVVPVRAGRPLPPDLRQPQLGERHSRIRAREGRDGDLRADRAARDAARRGATSTASSTRPRRRGAATSSRIPAQSNFSGVQHPLEWIDARAGAAAGTCCSTPRRSRRPTDWISRAGRPTSSSQSFYKMFGYPTGVGCLLARREALAKLHRPWFAGGTITVASVQGDKYYLAEGESAFEDGTLDFLALPAVEIGFDHIEAIGHADDPRARPLPHRLAARPPARAAARRRPAARAALRPADRPTAAAAIVTFNFYDADGTADRSPVVEERANAREHLAAHRLLLQSRRRRDCARHDGHGAVLVLQAARARDAPDPRRFPDVHRRQEHRRGAGVARDRVERGRRRPLHRFAKSFLS